MSQIKYIFIIAILCATNPMFADSLLQATAFPKTINDVSFQDKWEIMAEDYANYDALYDSETGKCISGCGYVGFTFGEEQQDSDEATDYYAELVEEANEKALQEETSVSYDAIPMRPPVKSDITISGDFGWRNTVVQGKKCIYLHNGVDISINTGTPIYATASGQIITAATGYNGGNGTYIRIKHINGLYSEYKHLSKLKVSSGANVTAGQLIGYSGNTGLSQGPHLHYDVYLLKNNRPAYIDILCPCAASNNTKNYKQSLNTIKTRFSCNTSVLGKKYRFQENTKKTQWRIASGHCMKKSSDKLPDEL